MQCSLRATFVNDAHRSPAFQQTKALKSTRKRGLWCTGCVGPALRPQRVKKGAACIEGGTGTPIRVRIDGASAS